MNQTQKQTTSIPRWVFGIALVMLVLVVGFFADGLTSTDAPLDGGDGGGGAFGTTVVAEAPAQDQPISGKFIQYSDLPAVLVTQLPAEAWDTLDLISTGGPFPYDRDGLTFQNREGFLPDHDRGHYREYTVTTPGESDRGARRIVAGADGALYYTDDHYASFREIIYED